MNITLIGMPGSGKSFISRHLSENYGFELLELDRLTEEKLKQPLQNILDSLGEEKFLKLQEEEAIFFTEGKQNAVISPGGSIVYTEGAMEHLNKISRIFYLKVPIEVVEKRIGGIPRGIVGLGRKTFEELYNERVKLYEKWAKHILDGEKDPKEITREIIEILNKK